MLLFLYFISIVYSFTFLPKFSSSTKFFKYSKITPFNEDENFGLKIQYTWDDILPYLTANVKLFIIQRHGQAKNNVVNKRKGYSEEDYKCYYQTLETENGLFDAKLTNQGINEVIELRERMKENKDFNVLKLDKFFISPLFRAIQTWQLTWNDGKREPVVKEKLRETIGINTSSKRQDLSIIQNEFPNVSFESSFTYEDLLWRSYRKENKKMRHLRAARVLNEIFNETKKKDKVISLVSHLGLINSILHVINYEKIDLKTGEMIIVLVKRHKFERIKYVSDKDLQFDYFKDICPNYPDYLPPPKPELYRVD